MLTSGAHRACGGCDDAPTGGATEGEGSGVNDMLGQIQSTEEVHNVTLAPIAPHDGRGGRLGLSQMINALAGISEMDGYKVVTDQHTYHVLIDNDQSCCESWGYLASDDDLAQYVGATLAEVRLTDKALNQQVVEASGYYEDGGGIQFVDFVTDRGVFQLAVYNGHNGYYGHGILVAKDDEIILNETL